MASSATKLVLSLLLCLCPAFSHCAEHGEVDPNCPPFSCGEKLGHLEYPFCNTTYTECGFFTVDGCNQTNQTIELVKGSGKWYDLLDIINPGMIISVRNRRLQQQLENKDCEAFNNLSLPKPSSLLSLAIIKSINLFKCNHSVSSSSMIPPHIADFNYTGCVGYNVYYIPSILKPLPTFFAKHCSVIQLPVHFRDMNSTHDPFKFIDPEFLIDTLISDECINCSLRGGVCRYDSEGVTLFQYTGDNKWSSTNDKQRLKLKIGLGTSLHQDLI